ncbi:unnamed protein product [Cylindrotheca closterium]|uniref:VWFD domain-containing protein n=1 Tax=Cylindrotheca closterium TaxID=2856 RepID=A0AAD2FJ08_9STRA|nr:unnamed protein product [Cylindrotheca closterium]
MFVQALALSLLALATPGVDAGKPVKGKTVKANLGLCSAQAECIDFTIKKRDSSRCKPDGNCPVEVCMILDTTKDGCMKEGPISHLCAASDGDGCAAFEEDGITPLTGKGNSTDCTLTGADESAAFDGKCEPTDDQTRIVMCQEGEAGETLFWALKDSSVEDFASYDFTGGFTFDKDSTTCSPTIECTGDSGFQCADPSNGMFEKTRVWKYTIPANDGGACDLCAPPPEEEKEPVTAEGGKNNLALCSAQKDCIDFTINKRESPSCNLSGNCGIEVCLILDTTKDGCAKEGPISHLCAASDAHGCAAYAADGTPMTGKGSSSDCNLTGLDGASAFDGKCEPSEQQTKIVMCQEGEPGETLHWGLKDSSVTDLGSYDYTGDFTFDNDSTTCSPVIECTGDSGLQCADPKNGMYDATRVWKYTIPTNDSSACDLCGSSGTSDTNVVDSATSDGDSGSVGSSGADSETAADSGTNDGDANSDVDSESSGSSGSNSGVDSDTGNVDVTSSDYPDPISTNDGDAASSDVDSESIGSYGDVDSQSIGASSDDSETNADSDTSDADASSTDGNSADIAVAPTATADPPTTDTTDGDVTNSDGDSESTASADSNSGTNADSDTSDADASSADGDSADIVVAPTATADPPTTDTTDGDVTNSDGDSESTASADSNSGTNADSDTSDADASSADGDSADIVVAPTATADPPTTDTTDGDVTNSDGDSESTASADSNSGTNADSDTSDADASSADGDSADIAVAPTATADPPTTVNPPTAVLPPIVPDTDLASYEAGSQGDPHFKTWRNEHYEYHGQCDMVLVKDPNFADGLGLDVQIRTKLVRFWSYIKSAAIRIGNDVFEIEGSVDGPIGEIRYWYNMEFKGPVKTVGGFPLTIRSNGQSKKQVVQIDLGSKYPGSIIEFQIFKEFVKVDFLKPTADAFGNTVGMLGDFRTGKTLARDRATEMHDFRELGNEWQVHPHDMMLFHITEQPQFPTQCLEPEDPRGARRRRLEESSVSLDDAEKACADLTDELDRKDCVYDIIATQDMTMAGAY